MRELVMGIDAGTIRVKALAVALDGSVLTEAALPTPWQRSGAEARMDANELMDVVPSILAHLEQSDPWPSETRPRGSWKTMIDASGSLLSSTPATRADLPRDVVTTEDFHGHVEMRLNNEPSVAKMLLVGEHLPSTSKATRFLSVAEWIVHRLGGERVSDISLFSRTGLSDVVERTPSHATVDLVGPLPPGPVVQTGDDCGTASHAPACEAGALGVAMFGAIAAGVRQRPAADKSPKRPS